MCIAASQTSYSNVYCHFVNKLQQAITALVQGKIRQELLKTSCDWVEFKMNVSHASHMGGAWERHVHTVRNVLASLHSRHGIQLDDETLRTFMVEAVTINSPDMPETLTPNRPLTMRSKIVLSPHGNFQRVDLYSRKRWFRVQHLAN